MEQTHVFIKKKEQKEPLLKPHLLIHMLQQMLVPFPVFIKANTETKDMKNKNYTKSSTSISINISMVSSAGRSFRDLQLSDSHMSLT